MNLTEKEIMYILHEAKMLLTEDQESDSIKKAIALYMDMMGCDKKTAEKFVRIDLRNDFPNLRYKKPGKFILGVTRMFLNGDFRTGDAIQPLNTTLTYVASEAHYNEYDKNLNGLSANEIINRFADAVKADAEADRERLAQQEYDGNTNYEIVRVDTFEETSQYRQYCYPEDPWCITKYPSMLNSYTNNGIGQFYFCLRNGFETMEPIKGDGCPLDEYGVSMFAVCVDGNGRLKTSTCRWNHSNGGDDHILTTEQISKLIGRNFYDVFKPNNKLEEKMSGIKQRLQTGENIRDIFERVKEISDGIVKVFLDDLGFNFVNNNTRELLSEKWFEYCEETIVNDFITVRLNNEWCYFSLIDRKTHSKIEAAQIIGNKIKQLLDGGASPEALQTQITFYSFRKSVLYDYIEVVCMGLHNIIENNKLKFEKWYASITRVSNVKGDYIYYRVENPTSGKYYFINENEENVLGVEYDWMSSTVSTYNTITITDDKKTNIISLDNPTKKLCKRSFERYISICFQREDGSYIFSGQDDKGYILCDENGRDLLNMYFDDISSTYSNLIIYCRKDDKSAIIFIDDLSISEWFDEIDRTYVSKYSPFTKVYKAEKVNMINCLTKKIFPYWFDEIIDIYMQCFKVKENGLYNLISEDGKLLSKEWFYDIETSLSSIKLIVTNTEGKQNILNVNTTEGTSDYELKHWYDKVELLNYGSILIEDDGVQRRFDNYEYMFNNV